MAVHDLNNATSYIGNIYFAPRISLRFTTG